MRFRLLRVLMRGILMKSLNCSNTLPAWARRVRRFCARNSCCISMLSCLRVRWWLLGVWRRC
eukprot:7098858-Pyramimonas_sp.AAC.1